MGHAHLAACNTSFAAHGARSYLLQVNPIIDYAPQRPRLASVTACVTASLEPEAVSNATKVFLLRTAGPISRTFFRTTLSSLCATPAGTCRNAKRRNHLHAASYIQGMETCQIWFYSSQLQAPYYLVLPSMTVSKKSNAAHKNMVQ